MYGSGATLQDREITFVCDNCPTDIDGFEAEFDGGVAYVTCPNCQHPHVIEDRNDTDI